MSVIPQRIRRRLGASLESVVAGKTVLVTGASSGIGRETARKVAAAGGIPLLVARGAEALEHVRADIVAAGGEAEVHPTDLSDLAAIDALVARLLGAHGSVDFVVNNAGRSIRRSIALSYDRFHDFERTMQLNYFAPVRLILGLLPTMRERRSGHFVNVSSIGVQANPPRFAAYVASKAALDAFTRIASTETLGDKVTFTTIHMPLVRTPMIAPTKLYDSFPAISPDDAADLVCDALRLHPKQLNTALGTFGEVAYALTPRAVDRVLHRAYEVFPDSTAARGDPAPDHPSTEAAVLARITKGVHW